MKQGGASMNKIGWEDDVARQSILRARSSKTELEK